MQQLDEEIIQAWTAEELIKEVWHELNQKSAISLSFIEMLAIEDSPYGFTNEKQKEMLQKLQKEIKIIRLVTESMLIWHQGQKDNA